MNTRLKKGLLRIGRRNFAFAFTLEYRRYRQSQDSAREPLIIFQMGKVGSSTLVNTLKQMGIEQSVYQVHVLTDEWIDRVYRMYKDASKVEGRAVIDEHLLASRYLRTLMDRFPSKRWNVITLIRDPIARNISAFFQAFPIHYPEVARRFDAWPISPQARAEEMIDLFLRDFDKHNVPIEWFDRHMQPAFGIDVYAEPFDPDAGYHIYRQGHANLLLLRLEDLKRSAGPALKSFMNLDRIELRDANISENKDYSAEYRLFRDKVRLPQSYIDSMYETRYMRHFYSGEEIARLKQQWSRN